MQHFDTLRHSVAILMDLFNMFTLTFQVKTYFEA